MKLRKWMMSLGVLCLSACSSPQVEPTKEVSRVSGNYSDSVAASIGDHKSEFVDCYEKATNTKGLSPSGTVRTVFVISPIGTASSARVESSTFQNPEFEKCVVRVLANIQFAKPPRAGEVEVRYPFRFKSLEAQGSAGSAKDPQSSRGFEVKMYQDK